MKIEKAIELVILAKGRFLDSPEKYEALHMAKEALEKQLNSGWIVTNERLPDKSGFYLIQ